MRWCTPLILGLRRQRQADLQSSRLIWVTKEAISESQPMKQPIWIHLSCGSGANRWHSPIIPAQGRKSSCSRSCSTPQWILGQPRLCEIISWKNLKTSVKGETCKHLTIQCHSSLTLRPSASEFEWLCVKTQSTHGSRTSKHTNESTNKSYKPPPLSQKLTPKHLSSTCVKSRCQWL